LIIEKSPVSAAAVIAAINWQSYAEEREVAPGGINQCGGSAIASA
jgi:hypothetical protein